MAIDSFFELSKINYRYVVVDSGIVKNAPNGWGTEARTSFFSFKNMHGTGESFRIKW